MKSKPTLLLLHGGPGGDHTYYKPYFSQFSDIAQVVYLDHRGNGRSAASSTEYWNLDQWGDDVHGFCQALGIERPIVLGASFGGFVAMNYAIAHPTHPAGLALISTQALGASDPQERVDMFTKLGGPTVGALAYRRFIDKAVDNHLLADWMDQAYPLYTRAGVDLDALKRGISKREVTHWFMRDGGEMQNFNYTAQLTKVQCPTLVMGGTLDPMTPIKGQRDIAAALPKHLVQYHEFEDCGHGVVQDKPAQARVLIRAFIEKIGKHLPI
jgi:pimeloyl-ACP methyl ester carboxylesterase